MANYNITGTIQLAGMTGALDVGGDAESVVSGIIGLVPSTASAAYTRAATIVEDRDLLASASATTLNNNNLLAALIADLQAAGIIT